MRLIYLSVHEPLEYDEVTLLRSLGHTVFPLGFNFGDHAGMGGLRPPIDLGPDFPKLREAFDRLGCRFDVRDAVGSLHLTPEFVARFDASVIMFAWPVIDRLWSVLKLRPIILRTIGQGLDVFEPAHRRLRAEGVRIVRYAAVEEATPGYAGADALIRFTKDPDYFAPWTGERPFVLSFASSFAQRFPAEFGLWQRATAALPTLLGGRGNGTVPPALGGIEAAEQLRLLRECRAYFYCSGLEIPYTLNFMEAWMAGIPAVVMHPSALGIGEQYWEIGRLITPGVDALLVRDAAQAEAALRSLLQDHALAARIGAAGRASAIRLFGRPNIGPQWQHLLAGLA